MSEEHLCNGPDLTGTDFSGIDLSGQSLAHSTITGCKFGNCQNARFVCSHGSGVDFRGADITGATFEKADESVIRSLIGATWNGIKVKAVSGWLVTEGYWAFVTNAFVSIGCMARPIDEWNEIGESMDSLQVLLNEQPRLNLDETFDWWKRNAPLLRECSADFAARCE